MKTRTIKTMKSLVKYRNVTDDKLELTRYGLPPFFLPRLSQKLTEIKYNSGKAQKHKLINKNI